MTRRQRITIAITIAIGTAILTAIAIWPDHARSQDMPPIEAGIATAVALRGLAFQDGTTLPPPADPFDTWEDLFGTPTDAQWDRMANCESGGNWSINTGNGYFGGLQFALSSWRAVGGTGYPHQASRAEQIHRADRLWLIQGWGAWPSCSRKLGYR